MEEVSLTYLEREGSGQAALRIRTAANEGRIPTHFIALIDVSESMEESNKLTHVKHCMSLLLQFLTPADTLSLVTFGEDSKVVLKRVKADGAAASTVAAAIADLHTDGCTNLSAGLAAVCQILEEGAGASSSSEKPGLLLLTDGHANRGVSSTDSLLDMTKTISERFPSLSFSFIAYGTNHNADLLQRMSAQQMGPYSVVEQLESAALAMGEALGGVVSCCAQNVVVRCPVGSRAKGPYKVGADGMIRIGDLYSGSEVLLLLTLEAGPVTVEGITLPNLQTFRVEPISTFDTSRNVEIELAQLRIECSDLFRRIREGGHNEIETLQRDITAFEGRLQDTAYDGNPVADMIRQEVVSLRAALAMAGRGRLGSEFTTHIAAHEQYTLLGRGSSQPIRVRAYSPPRIWSMTTRHMPTHFPSQTNMDDENENPVEFTTQPPPTSYLSPTASRTTRRIATQMQVLSASQSVPADPRDQEH